jgi:hypothetical protein
VSGISPPSTVDWYDIDFPEVITAWEQDQRSPAKQPARHRALVNARDVINRAVGGLVEQDPDARLAGQFGSSNCCAWGARLVPSAAQ